jgi:hypothetical protein
MLESSHHLLMNCHLHLFHLLLYHLANAVSRCFEELLMTRMNDDREVSTEYWYNIDVEYA